MFWIQDSRLKVRCMELLVAQSKSAFIATAIACLLLLIGFYPDVGALPFLLWGLVYIFSGACRVWTGLEFMGASTATREKPIWFQLYALCIFASGVCWGAFLLYLAHDATTLQGTILFLTYTALTAGAVTAYAVSLPIFLAFSLPLVLPVLVSLTFSFDSDALLICAVVVCWYLFMVATARRFSQFAMRSLGHEYRNAKLVEELEEQNRRSEVLAEELIVLSNTDALTDLYNRRYFDEKIREEWSRAVRANQPLSLILCDIDFFKNYNDSLGHIAGDKCLEKVADVFRKTVRDGTDFVARYGGEEFAIVVSGTKSYRARVLAERIQKALIKVEIAHPASAVSELVTLSMGIATVFPSKQNKVEQLIDLADKSLYDAKNAGRNQIVICNLDEQSTIDKQVKKLVDSES